MLIMGSVRRLVCVTDRRVLLDALSTHVGLLCRIDTTSTVGIDMTELGGGGTAHSRSYTGLEGTSTALALTEVAAAGSPPQSTP